MKTETAVAELVQTAFEHFGGERDCEAVVLRPRKYGATLLLASKNTIPGAERNTVPRACAREAEQLPGRIC